MVGKTMQELRFCQGKTVSISAEIVNNREEFGPAALWIAGDECWVIGSWDGEIWHDDQGFPIDPLVCCLLPDPREPVQIPLQGPGRRRGWSRYHRIAAAFLAVVLPLLSFLASFADLF